MTVQAALDELHLLLGDRLSRSKSELDQHATSETYFPPAPPDAVAFPQTAEEVSALMKICARAQCPVVGWGAGTSLEGQAQAFSGGVVVDFRLMNKVLAVSAEDMDVRVQPGLTREALNEELRATGLFFPVDPGANASLGGMAMTRASGTTAVRYGTMRDNVMGLEVVLADGRVIRTGTRARKSSAGYDLTALMVGSEGTLGLVTELTLRLRGQPEAITAAVCAFDAMSGAVETVIETIQMGIPIARIEFVDAAMVSIFNKVNGASLPEGPHLMVEFHGAQAEVRAQAESFGTIAKTHGAVGFDWATRPEDRTRLWDMRHRAHWSTLAHAPEKRALVTDICVPISRLAQAVEDTAADIAKSIVTGPILGHVGDGNFHAILLFDPDAAEELAAVKALSHRMVERALAMGGTATGEHGIGIGKTAYMQAEHGEGWQVMGALKEALDPAGILNPGKLVPRRDLGL